MPLDYHLSPDSPLLHDGVVERITQKPYNGSTYDAELELEIILNGAQGLTHLDPAENDKIRSLMQVDEYLALLSFPGVVWFVSQRLHVEPKQAAVAVLSGMPWPIWGERSLRPLLGSVSNDQARFLNQLFWPREADLFAVLKWDHSLPPPPHLKNIHTLEVHERIGEELARREKHAERAWKDLARKTGQSEQDIYRTARAMRNYLDCLDQYRWHQHLSQQER